MVVPNNEFSGKKNLTKQPRAKQNFSSCYKQTLTYTLHLWTQPTV